MKKIFVMVVLVCLCSFVGCATSSDYKVQMFEQQTGKTADIHGLASAGAVMLIADFFLQTTIHEGSHAIMSIANGYEIVGFYPYPTFSKEMGFSFGYYESFIFETQSSKTMALIKITPKIVDVGMLSSYALLEEFDVLPNNQYAQLAIWTVALGAWVDLTRDFCSGVCYKGGVNNDLKKFEESMGYTSPWEKFAVRGTIVLLAGFSAYPLYNGLRKVIDPAITKNLDMVDGLTVGPGMVGYRLEF